MPANAIPRHRFRPQLFTEAPGQNVARRLGVAPQVGMAGGVHQRLLGRAEKIDWVNDPTRFGVNLETKLANLPDAGKAKQRPWADTYWPTYQDGINHRWQNTGNFLNDLSPAEKFDAAFNGWDPQAVKNLKPFQAEWGGFDQPFDQSYYDKLGPLAKYCSEFKGNKPARTAAKAGKLNSDGTAKNGKKEDDFGGVETWWGLCHAWCPAAIREKEPKKAVVHNGIRFEVSDIKALLIACYDRSNSVMIGGRNAEKDIASDNVGRPKQANARDINPGTFHILLGTMLGRDGQSFVEDRTANYEVWNQPIAEYRVTEKREITKAEASRMIGENDGKYKANPEAVKFYYVQTEVDYITESHAGTEPNAHNDYQERTDPYEYVLELNARGEIIGGEWVGSSKEEHPDFLWHVFKDGGTPLSPHVDLDQVRILLAKSVGDDGPVGEKFNKELKLDLKKGQTRQVRAFTAPNDGRLEFTVTGRGDLDIYAKVGQRATYAADGEPRVADLAMYEPGSNERKTMTVKKGDKVYVTVRADQDGSRGTLKITEL